MPDVKRYVADLRALYECLFRDAESAFPTLGGEFKRDLNRLLDCIETRGIHLCCEDLAAAGKHFDRCLSNGQYVCSGLPLTKRVSRAVQVPKFLRGLYLLVFDQSGQLKESCNYEAILFIRQIYFAAKKMDYQCSDEAIRREIDEFLAIDDELPIPEKFWSSSSAAVFSILDTYEGFSQSPLYRESFADADFANSAQSSTLLRRLDEVAEYVVAQLGPYHWNQWCFKHGPGAISDKDRYSNKYDWVNWSERLENVFPIADCGYHNYASWAGRMCEGAVEVGSKDPASKLIAVPKTFTKPRLIAAEPSEHQWCQQNIWHYFCKRCETSELSAFVSFRNQQRNQELALKGSRDRSLATLDLSAASDRVSCHFVGQLFRKNIPLLWALQATRTQWMEIRYPKRPYGCQETVIRQVRKFSTMGNACTFPVETLGFLTVVLAAVLTQRKQKATPETIRALADEVAVFGDDLVVPSDSRMLVVTALEALGFKVNANKSYWIGRFRESCGVDAFNGVDITPTYWKGRCTNKPESIAATVATSNNFYKKWMLRTAQWVAEAIEQVEIPVVSMDSGVCGLSSFVKPEIRSYTNRFNEHLQRWESFVPVLIMRTHKAPIADDTALLQYFTEKPDPYTKWESGVAQEPRLKIRSRWVPTTDLVSYDE